MPDFALLVCSLLVVKLGYSYGRQIEQDGSPD